METTIEKRQPLIKVMDEILIFLKNDVYLKFTKVFQFPGDSGTFIGHINIWDDNAPFYFIFDRNSLRKLQIKGYNKCLFIPNSFVQGYDKNHKMYLRCTDDNPNCYLVFHPVTSIADMRNLVILRKSGHSLYSGFSKNGKLHTHGECIEVVYCK